MFSSPASPATNRSYPLILNTLSSGSSSPFNIPTSKPSNLQTTNLDAASSLTPLFATLTKNTRGWGTSASFLCVSSAYSVSQRYPFLSPTAVSCKLSPLSSPLAPTNSFTIRTSAKPATNPFRIRTSKTQHLKPFRTLRLRAVLARRIRIYKKTGEGAPSPAASRCTLKPLLDRAHPYTRTCKKGPAAREPRYSPCAAS